MRVLILSFYYDPDLCAGSFRTTALVAALRQRAPEGTAVDVVTTLPNRYASFAQPALEHETSAGLEIRRIRLPPHNSDINGQSRSFLSFARQARSIVADREYDIVVATSSRLMTAALGAWIARSKRASLYLDIRDIFVDTITDVLPAPLGWLAGRLLAPLEGWTIRSADRINLVSPGFESYFRDRYGERSFARFTNGIDDEFLDWVPTAPKAERGELVTIVYAGNIGEGQGLHQILPGLATELRGRARFIVIGDGGRRALLEREISKAGVHNIALQSPMRRTELLAVYRNADVLFLHLGSHPALERVLPSKLFEYAALGKPVLAGVSGCPARFIQEELSNAAIFPPGDVQGAVAAFKKLELRDFARPEFTAKYARRNISCAMADDILSLSRDGT
jgi:glycosyltransferase involved in cell wall biosynthesis